MATGHYIYSSNRASGKRRTDPPPKPKGPPLAPPLPPLPAPVTPAPISADVIRGGAGYQAAIQGLSRHGANALLNWGGLGAGFFAAGNKPLWMSDADWATAANANANPGRLSQFFQLGQNRERGVSGVLTRLQGARVGAGARALKNNELSYQDRVAAGNAAALNTLQGLGEQENTAFLNEGQRLAQWGLEHPTVPPPPAPAPLPAVGAVTTPAQNAAVISAGVAANPQLGHGAAGYQLGQPAAFPASTIVKPAKRKPKPAPHYIYASAPGSKRY